MKINNDQGKLSVFVYVVSSGQGGLSGETPPIWLQRSKETDSDVGTAAGTDAEGCVHVSRMPSWVDDESVLIWDCIGLHREEPDALDIVRYEVDISRIHIYVDLLTR